MNLNEVLNIKPKSLFHSDYSHYICQLPIHESQWGKGENNNDLFYEVAQKVDLPIHHALTKALQNEIGAFNRIKKNHKLIDLFQSKKSLDDWVNETQYQIGILRNSASTHISQERIAAALKSELYSTFQNPTIAYLLTNVTHRIPPHTRYYYVPTLESLKRHWSKAQSKLWKEVMNVQLSFETAQSWNGYVLRSDKLKTFTQAIRKS